MNLLQVNSSIYGEDIEGLMTRLEDNKIQTRPVWTLNHNQKPYKKCQYYKIENSKELVKNSLCLPSSPNLTNDQLGNIIDDLYG